MTAKKKLFGALGGVAALGATVALTAGTFSYFSDTESAGVATVSTGTLKLDIFNGKGEAQQTFTVTDAVPGQTVYKSTDDQAICFENTGSMTGVLRLQIVPTSGHEDFNKSVIIDSAGFNTYTESKPLNEPLSLFDAAALTKNGVNVTQLGGTKGNRGDWDLVKCIPLTVSISPNAGNTVQGVTGGFTIVADLVQGNNSDINPVGPKPAFPAPKA
jgi:predicted ribosomally synthesized peptide with SipW-like signal peptide